MTPTDKVLKEFDEQFKDFNGISKRIAENNSTWTDAECKDIKSFLTRALTQAYRRGVEETVEKISNEVRKSAESLGANPRSLKEILEARLTETPLPPR